MGNYLGELLGNNRVYYFLLNQNQCLCLFKAPLVQEDFNVSFLNELFAATSYKDVVGDVLSEILHNASNRLVNIFYFILFFLNLINILNFNLQGHTSVIKIFKSSNVNVNLVLKDLENYKEFLKEKVINSKCLKIDSL